MYEHSYAMDYGGEHARYIDAVFANADWDEVSRRLERARSARAVLEG
jgi:Fe-Mn family superoxide dismutase